MKSDLFLIRGRSAEPQGEELEQQQRSSIDSHLNEVSEGAYRAGISPWFPPFPSHRPPAAGFSPVLFAEGLERSIERVQIRPTFLKHNVCKNIRSSRKVSGPGSAPGYVYLGIETAFRVSAGRLSLQCAPSSTVRPCTDELSVYHRGWSVAQHPSHVPEFCC